MLATLYAVQISTRTLDSQLSAFYKLRFISLKKKKEKKKERDFQKKTFHLQILSCIDIEQTRTRIRFIQ